MRRRHCYWDILGWGHFVPVQAQTVHTWSSLQTHPCLSAQNNIPYTPLGCWEAVTVLKKLLILSPAWVRLCSVLGEMWCEGRGLRHHMLIPSPCPEQLWRQDSELGSNPGDRSCLSRSARKPLPMVMSSSPPHTKQIWQLFPLGGHRRWRVWFWELVCLF